MAPVRIDHGLRPGLVFMTLHFPDEVDTNLLTIDAADPKSGTAEFKATAVRIDLTDVTFIDSTGLRVLFALVTTLERLQVDLELQAPESSPARKVIDLSGLSSLVRLVPDG